MIFTVEIEGLDELRDTLADANTQLERDLDRASVAAAEDGIDEAYRNHPYQDRTYNLTNNAHVEYGNVTMVWPEDYATYVDKGTRRSRPYPFTPQAIQHAEYSLEVRSTVAADKYADKVNGS